MISSLKKMTLVGISILTLTSCSAVYDKHVQWQTIKPETFPVITAIGQAPISLQNSTNETQRMLMAINASKIAAYAELAEQVYGQQINSSTSMSNLILNDQEFKASVQGVIRGAKVIKSYPVGDTYTTELHLDFKNVYDLYIASSQNKEIKHVRYY
ncbi:LPP20 family lipoprotein [Colwellia sp. 1_MG-2023]|uniref:LPP20 family lipoprotein n=1 Tax=Colwellia sp. 1_MG-2023 TaxID=3062649 RepID=UPI0026E25461|nr:LPP20 family lipoprotein [Colwellia sp. 1_MG-2023]MDO6444421.1 LPP20 family lipoprotein [Colwellia sp. 1_MG-2023]